MKELKIARDVAEQELERLADAWEVDTRTELMDEEDRNGFNNLWGALVYAIERGKIEVNESGNEVDVNLHDGNTLTVTPPNGVAMLAMDKHKKGKDIHKAFAMLAAMTGKPEATMSKLPGQDIKVLQNIVALYMG